MDIICNRRLLFAWLIVGALALMGTALWSAAPDKKNVRVESKHIISEKNDGKIRLTTFAAAKVFHEDSVFTAETIVARSEGKVHEFTCTGNPVFTDPENRITADKVLAYSTPRRAEFIGNVKMVSTPRSKEKDKKQGEVREKVSQEPSVTTCDKLSYNYAEKTAEARGNVVVVQKQRTVWADTAVYEQKLELITLRGNVRLKNQGEEEIKAMRDADTVTVSLENDWIDIKAKPGGFVTFDLEVAEEENAKPE
jgi:lipopolysaccharide assembly outer membrane protein LptD (OstA)